MEEEEMAIYKVTLAEWAKKTVGLEAARRLLVEAGMDLARARDLKKIEAIDWLIKNDPYILFDSYMIEQKALAGEAERLARTRSKCGATPKWAGPDWSCTREFGHDDHHARGTSHWNE